MFLCSYANSYLGSIKAARNHQSNFFFQIEKLSGIGMQLTSTTGNQDDDYDDDKDDQDDDHDDDYFKVDHNDDDIDRGPG